VLELKAALKEKESSLLPHLQRLVGGPKRYIIIIFTSASVVVCDHLKEGGNVSDLMCVELARSICRIQIDSH